MLRGYPHAHRVVTLVFIQCVQKSEGGGKVEDIHYLTRYAAVDLHLQSTRWAVDYM